MPRYPDFIIGGAPKCGTTSLHFILDQHKEIALPEEEIFYFGTDDPIVHPDFFFRDGKDLSYYDNRPKNKARLDQYAAKFEPLADVPFVGEDSTSYLLSATAAFQIQALLPQVRLIFMLRDPVARAYSQYWHWVKSGRAVCGFEDAITRYPIIILGSTYLAPLKTYFDILGPDRIQTVLFEDLIANKQKVVDSVTDFIGAPRMEVDSDASWFNRTRYPTSMTGQLLLNRIGSHIVRQRYSRHLGGRDSWTLRLGHRIHHHWFDKINPIFLKAERPPAMRDATRAYLTEHLSRRNDGLSELLGRDLSKVWKGFTG
ncbi:MAG: sulfotransferase [Pseudomonadota bacterium]